MASYKDMLNLAKRGRLLSFGEDVFFLASKGRLSSIVVATDISSRYLSRLNSCSKNLDLIDLGLNKEELGDLIDMPPINFIGVKDRNIFKKIKSIRKEINNGKEKE